MNTVRFALAAVAALLPVCAQVAPQPRQTKLLLVLTVDQFRYDYLTRFRSEYNAGLARLLTQGAVFTNAFYEHAPTVTAVGHSTIMSGASPVLSGIVANDWYDRQTGKIVTSVSDEKSILLGTDGTASSPHRLQVSTVPDEIKMSGKGESKAVGISIKDRSAILPVGRMADAAYWFSNEAGCFVSSSWYMKTLPAWVEQYNARKPGERYLSKEWLPAKGGAPLAKLTGVPDTMFYSNLEKTPYANELLEEFAELAVENEKLGTHAGVDVLSLSLSGNDYVGHAYGPDSPQVREISLHTDRLLGRLFAFLDRKIGMRNVLVVLTADHAVSPTPEANAARKMPGGRLKDKDYQEAVEKALSLKFGGGKWVVGKNAEQLYLNPAMIAGREEEVRRFTASVLRNQPHVNRVYTKDQILAGNIGRDLVGSRVANGFHSTQGPDVVTIMEPYFIFGTSATTHGSPYNYDAHVPLILMGSAIKPGRYHAAAAVNDIAPTVATLLDVEIPAGSMGRVLTEALAQ
jgi:predicted AlkP superfamily pyrophosphatase or phosphodiesterase